MNLHLERVGSAERVDHRSRAQRGLDEQKEKYSVELDETLQQYKQLQSLAEAEAQQKIRNDAAAAASARLQQAYGKHYNAQLARESQQDVAAWLGESTQPASIRAFLKRAEKKTHSAPQA